MKLVFPTNFGKYSFYTIVEIGNSSLKSVNIVEKDSSSFKILKKGSLMVKNLVNDKAFSVDELNSYFENQSKMINDSIDQFLMKKINDKG